MNFRHAGNFLTQLKALGGTVAIMIPAFVTSPAHAEEHAVSISAAQLTPAQACVIEAANVSLNSLKRDHVLMSELPPSEWPTQWQGATIMGRPVVVKASPTRNHGGLTRERVDLYAQDGSEQVIDFTILASDQLQTTLTSKDISPQTQRVTPDGDYISLSIENSKLVPLEHLENPDSHLLLLHSKALRCLQKLL